MKTENHIGIRLARKLQEWGCKIESEHCYYGYIDVSLEDADDGDLIIERKQRNREGIPAYYYYDIIVTHANSFFNKADFLKKGASWTNYSLVISEMLQQGKQKEADLYIEKHTIFNPKNK